jgi:hypothetical protein
METFDELKEICRRACHERNACKEGFEALMRAGNTAELMNVWRQNWQDIYQSKFSDVMAEHIVRFHNSARLAREMRRSDVFVNESSERGLVIVCRPCGKISVGGTAKCYVFGDGPAEIAATDHAQVYCRSSRVRISLRGYATAVVSAGDCELFDRSFLKGTPDSVAIHGAARFEGNAGAANVRM